MATVAIEQGSPRRPRISRKPLRREGRMPPLNLYARVRVFVQFCTRDRGCSVHPVFPAPSSLNEGERVDKTSGAPCRENIFRRPGEGQDPYAAAPR
jgi:hypothetical protein